MGYTEQFPRGTKVRIADRAYLENFMVTWKWHHQLQPEQLDFAGVIAEIKDVGFYHGGDVIYGLKDIPGTWHEQCLTGA